MHQQPEDDSLITFRQSVNFFYLFASCYATCLLVFIRHSFGQEALGKNGVGAVIWMFLYAGYCANADALLWQFILASFIALVIQRVITGIRWFRGWRGHSQFAGYRWLVNRLFPRVTKDSTASLIEAGICAAIGLLLIALSPSLGQFIIWGAVAILVKSWIVNESIRVRLRDMHDAEIETRFFHEAYRGRYGRN